MRYNKDMYYIEIAKAVANRSTCLRRNFGAVLVKDDQLISTGYNGPPRGEEHCKECYREQMNIKPGTQYEECKAVHAEMNVVINAARAGISTIGATLYVYGLDKTLELISDFLNEITAVNPCKMCARIIKNAGIIKVIGRDGLDLLEWDFKETY